VLEIRLEPLGGRHLDGVRDLVADPAVLQFTRIPEPPAEDFAESWIAGYDAARDDGRREGFAAINGDGEFVGIGLAPTIERKEQEIELGYIVPAWARGRGVATDILGCVREGVMRSIHLKQGQRVDAGLWSRLPSDLDPGGAA
jgi:RimJ/RimL family protein N-acetyltransferase